MSRPRYKFPDTFQFLRYLDVFDKFRKLEAEIWKIVGF